ncbi:hypothetical protein BDR07DRAFT_1461022 [Suillus spraguei]|nr:hypothetical protein BDR07DRAFT_1461022 [Suillus spraguei]
MSSGKYKLQNAARPWLYVSLVDGKIVGNSWFANVRENGLATFQAVRGDGQVIDDYIYFDLILSFPLSPQRMPRAPALSLIGVVDTDWVWATVSADQNLPVRTVYYYIFDGMSPDGMPQISILSKDGSTAESWVFEKVPEE